MGESKWIEGLVERFSDSPDARVEGRTNYDFLDIVVPVGRCGSALASYLLFECSCTRALIDLGYKDTMALQAESSAFFEE